MIARGIQIRSHCMSRYLSSIFSIGLRSNDERNDAERFAYLLINYCWRGHNLAVFFGRIKINFNYTLEA